MPAELSPPPTDGRSVLPADDAAVELGRRVLDLDEVAVACRAIRADDERTLGEQRLLTEIPAPPFGEARRAARMAELLADAGLDDVEVDGEGNVLARFPPTASEDRAPLAVTAHLDTVFPAGTDVSVREEGDRLIGPGISDDGRGLAALLSLARALGTARIALDHPLLFVATVGEEGAGDLRGVRHLFGEGGALADDCAGFVSLDGAGLRRIVNAGLGSRRYRVRASGPGGHSWGDWGTPNPIHALGRAVASLVDLPLAGTPRTTLSVGRWSGGTSINAIPREAWFEFEIRSTEPEALEGVHEQALERIRASIDGARENPKPGMDPGAALRLEIESMGRRPAGHTPREGALVRAAAAASRVLGVEPELAVSSTDANIPMAAGIPAITLGAGGEAGGPHTPGEWYRNVRGPDGVERVLLTLLLADGRRGRLDGRPEG